MDKKIGCVNHDCEQCKAQQQEPVAWRELCRRLYVELYWCDRQMMETLNEDGEPVWTQGQTVRDVLADAKAALETSPQPSKPWVGLTKEDRYKAIRPLYCDDETAALAACHSNDEYEAIETKLKEKNNG